MNANTVSRIVSALAALAAFAALGLVSGIAAPQAAQAQGLVEIYKAGKEPQGNYLFTRISRDAAGNYLFTNRASDPAGNYLFTNLVCDPLGNYLFTNSQPAPIAPSDFGVAIPFSNTTTKHTTGGYSVTIESKANFAGVTGGNYLFAFDANGNYLFTNSANGLLALPGGWSMDRNGNVIARDGSHVVPNAPGHPRNSDVPVTAAYLTPEGYTLALYKDGSRSVSLPSGEVFFLRDLVEIGMDPAGVYYD